MFTGFVLSALVLVAGTGWVKGETLHPKLEPVVFKTIGECRAKRQEIKKLYKVNKEHLEKYYDVKKISLVCKKKG